MIYEQFIVYIVELIMLSRQPILLYNFHNMRVTWLFYHVFKLQVHILHRLENISISQSTSTQYIDFVNFYISMDLSTNYFAHFSGS